MKAFLNTCLLSMLVVLSSCAQQPTAPTAGVYHTVLVWLKPEFQTPEYIQILKDQTEQLRSIPGVITVAVGQPIASARPIVDDSFDLGVLMTFVDQQTMEQYLSHPTHKEFVKNYVRGKAARLQVYDF